MTLGTEQAINPAIFMAHQPHVVKISLLLLELWHLDRMIPEFKTVDAVFTFGNREERFSVPAFDAGRKDNLSIPRHGADVENAIDSQARHQMRIRCMIEIVAPIQRHMVRGKHGKFVPVKNAVALFLLPVAAAQELVVLLLKLFQSLAKVFFVHLADFKMWQSVRVQC